MFKHKIIKIGPKGEEIEAGGSHTGGIEAKEAAEKDARDRTKQSEDGTRYKVKTTTDKAA